MAHPQDTTLCPIQHNVTEDDFTAALAREGVQVIEDHDLGHLESGGYARLLHYVSPNSGRTIYVLELTSQYAIDGYESDIWQFAQAVTPDEAREFAASQREARNFAALIARRDRAEAEYAATWGRVGDVPGADEAWWCVCEGYACAWPRVESEPVDFAALAAAMMGVED